MYGFYSVLDKTVNGIGAVVIQLVSPCKDGAGKNLILSKFGLQITKRLNSRSNRLHSRFSSVLWSDDDRLDACFPLDLPRFAEKVLPQRRGSSRNHGFDHRLKSIPEINDLKAGFKLNSI